MAREKRNKKKQKGDIKRKKRSTPLALIKNAIIGGITAIVDSIADAFIWVSTAFFGFIKIFYDAFNKGIGGVMNRTYKKAGRVSPTNISRGVDGLIVKGGIAQDAGKIIGATFVYSIVVSVFVSVLAYIFLHSMLMVLGAVLAGFVVTWLIMYVILNLLADRRAAAIDMVLPDVLLIVASNMIAGLPPYNALMTAARPEFGPISEEIQRAVKDTMSGKSLINSLGDMANRTASAKLKRTIRLMIQGMRSGGDLPTVLQEIAEDLRIEQNIQKEMAASTMSYAMFIAFAILIGAPLLFGVSLTFVEIFSGILEKLNIRELYEQIPSGGMIMISELAVSPEFFRLYAILTLTVLGLFGGVLISIIQTGYARGAVTYAPALAIFSVVIFFVLQRVLIGFFGGMIV